MAKIIDIKTKEVLFDNEAYEAEIMKSFVEFEKAYQTTGENEYA